MVAVLDGDTPGIGTTIECGYFARMCQEEIARTGATNKKIIALYTDSRECSATNNEAKNKMLGEIAENQYSYLNLLLVGAVKRYGVIVRTIDEVIEELRKALKKYQKEIVFEETYDEYNVARGKFVTVKSIEYADGTTKTVVIDE